ncbi:hypothetical protein AYX13_04352 [Cryptococcus neoformans]|nr:hypothetical protein AYX13_04352 [Cryptococcus neoformans var. grubii]
MPPKKILIIMSDASTIPLLKKSECGKTTTDQSAGFFLMELAKPLSKFLSAGCEVTFASPLGKTPTPDPNSESLMAFALNFYERQRENDLIARMKRENGFASPRTFQSVSDEELDGFAAVFIPGGHAPLADLGADPELGRILAHFHREGKPTAVICHGPYGLLSTKATPEGTFLYKGYKITSWSDAEEKMMETLWGGEVPKVESTLREAGAEMVEGLGEKIGRITVDRELVSGGNPLAANALAEQVLKMVEAQ